MKWNKVTIVGPGLLGGSLGMALRERQVARCVVAYVRREASIDECERQGAVDQATCDLATAVDGADLLVLCTPISQMRGLLARSLSSLKPGAVVTDVGSVKSPLVKQLEPLARKGRAHYVGSHPMAGSEKTGVLAARPDLFENAICVVTPTRATSLDALGAAERLWQSVGCRLLRLSPGVHDKLVSRASHLPHVLAAHLVSLVLEDYSPAEQALLCATGFRDSTRIASGSPEMWRDIVLANRSHIVKALQQFTTRLKDFEALLDISDGDRLLNFFVKAKEKRDAWASTAQRTTTPE